MNDSASQLTEIKKIIQGLGADLHWSKDRTTNITAKTSLDKQLGLDSLSRLEFLGRVERKFNVSLGDQAYMAIDTIGQLLEALSNACLEQPIKQSDVIDIISAVTIGDSEAEIGLPHNAVTLNDVVEYHLKNHPQRVHLLFQEDGHKESILTYRELTDGAMNICEGLRKCGIRRGDAVALMLPTGLDYFFSFLGSILAGAIPVPIYPPSRPSQIEDHLIRHASILSNCRARLLITTDVMTSGIGRLLKLKVTSLESVKSPGELKSEGPVFINPAKPSDVAFLQYTSGSTGSPKGVILTHLNLLSNIRAMGTALDAKPTDIFVSWLPLYHDMGLIGAWLGSLYYGNRLIVMSPFSFLSRPYRWLSAIHRSRATLTAAPNFAFELCLRHVTEEEITSLDLSSLRAICNGAEAVMPSTVERFIQRFTKAKLRPTALMPVYGLAESSVGLAFPPLGQNPRIDVIERQEFLRRGTAKKYSENSEDAPMRLVSCGKPLVGHEIRVVDAADHELPERREGFVHFKGPSSTSGYLRNEAETKRLFHGEWLDSGDLGYIGEGDLFITGRVKDIIKHAGRNVHPEEIESEIGSLPLIRKGCVVVFGASDPQRGTEKLVVLAETRTTDDGERTLIKQEINRRVVEILGSAPDDIVLAAPHIVLKTSSGKVRRSSSKKLYESGLLDAKETSVRWQVLHFSLSAILNRVVQRTRTTWLVLRSIVLWGVISLIIFVSWPIMVLFPGLNNRWQITRMAARIACWLASIRLIITGESTSPSEPEPCIFVSNHSSYVDVVILTLCFKRPVSFIAKSELAKNPLWRWGYRRIGVAFVERFDLKKTIEDSQRVIDLVRRGASILSFPEGTFTRRPGILPFHLGPFLAAVQTGHRVCPIAIKGTRSILHPDDWILRPGLVEINFLALHRPVEIYSRDSRSPQSEWDRAAELANDVRQSIIQHCGEPDLSEERAFT